MNRLTGNLSGPQTLGSGRGFWGAFCAAVTLAALFPLIGNAYTVYNFAYLMVWTFMAMGLSLIWGYTGILSFGQTAFFGVAGYSYGVISINLGEDYGLTQVALLGALLIAAVFAVLIGYFLFYGGITAVFVSIVTLSITLVLETFMAQTAGPEWAIGEARLNGYNGMTGMPPLIIPWFTGQIYVQGITLFYFLLIILVAVYLLLRMLLNSRIGYILVGIRENSERTEMLGYDIRRYQLLAFLIGSTLAGFSGVMYTTWGQYLTPDAMGITAAVLPILWVAAGGRKDLTASVVATIVLVYLSQRLAIMGDQYALVVMGAILLIAVLFVPEGFVVAAVRFIGRLSRKKMR
jgi:ABC-type branched-subunit amino acid transport system permease subunit